LLCSLLHPLPTRTPPVATSATATRSSRVSPRTAWAPLPPSARWAPCGRLVLALAPRFPRNGYVYRSAPPREMRLRTRLGPSHWPLLQRLPTSLAMVLDPGLVLFAALPPLQLRWTAPLPGLRLMRRKSDQLGGVMRWQQFSRRNSPPQPAAASTATKPRRGPVQALLSFEQPAGWSIVLMF
jgi:hypothetical protein